eukprot:11052749-Alexandrium_andersonii.AAC.1
MGAGSTHLVARIEGTAAEARAESVSPSGAPPPSLGPSLSLSVGPWLAGTWRVGGAERGESSGLGRPSGAASAERATAKA